MRQLFTAALLLASATGHAAVLHDNGPVVDAQGLSILPSTVATLSLGVQLQSNNRIAEDFVVASGGWTITDLDFYAYQSNASAYTFTDVKWSIVSGDVNTGTAVASGLTASTSGGFVGWRVTASAPGNQTRPIYDIKVDIPDVTLSPGSYWLTWSIGGQADLAGPWQPLTSDLRTGTHYQATGAGSFLPLTDPITHLSYELPFQINGTIGAVPEPASGLLLVCGMAVLGAWRLRSKRS